MVVFFYVRIKALTHFSLGLENIEELQNHNHTEISKRAVSIVDMYFPQKVRILINGIISPVVLLLSLVFSNIRFFQLFTSALEVKDQLRAMINNWIWTAVHHTAVFKFNNM